MWIDRLPIVWRLLPLMTRWRGTAAPPQNIDLSREFLHHESGTHFACPGGSQSHSPEAAGQLHDRQAAERRMGSRRRFIGGEPEHAELEPPLRMLPVSMIREVHGERVGEQEESKRPADGLWPSWSNRRPESGEPWQADMTSSSRLRRRGDWTIRFRRKATTGDERVDALLDHFRWK